MLFVRLKAKIRSMLNVSSTVQRTFFHLTLASCSVLFTKTGKNEEQVSYLSYFNCMSGILEVIFKSVFTYLVLSL